MLSLGYRNFENLVAFYASELRQILAGRRASEVFSYNERRRLKKYGILTIARTNDLTKIKLTESAQSKLKDLESLE